VALSSARKSTDQLGYHAMPEVVNYPAKGSTIIYAGALVVLNGGYAEEGSTATGRIAIGRADKTLDTTGLSDGDLSVPVRRGVFVWKNSGGGDLIAQDDVGQLCYIVDDQTVALTSADATRSVAGLIVAVSTAGVFVLIGQGIGLAPGQVSAPSNIQTGTSGVMSGTPGTVTVSSATITAASKIYVTRNTTGGALGHLNVADADVTVGAPGSFIIRSSGIETSTINWLVVG